MFNLTENPPRAMHYDTQLIYSTNIYLTLYLNQKLDDEWDRPRSDFAIHGTYETGNKEEEIKRGLK